MVTAFNIRAYGILINEKKQILVSDEKVWLTGDQITKFPGGGLELGEGILDCLAREFQEELHIDIEIIEHIYTTDFFQQSAFNKSHQIISVYYLVSTNTILNYPVSNTPNYPTDANTENCRWISLDDFNANCVDLPVDKVAAEKLKFYLS